MYTDYDTPAEFFNIATLPIGAPVDTSGGYAIASATISLGCSDHATAANRFLTNLTAAQAALAGSTAQVIFGVVDAISERYNAIPVVDRPTKFSVNKSGYFDATTGEWVYNYAVSCRVSTGTPVAVNS